MWILARDPEGHKSAHREAGDAAVCAICDGAVMDVDVLDKFREINGKLPVRFYRCYVVRTHVIGLIGTAIVSVGLYDDDVMC